MGGLMCYVDRILFQVLYWRGSIPSHFKYAYSPHSYDFLLVPLRHNCERRHRGPFDNPQKGAGPLAFGVAHFQSSELHIPSSRLALPPASAATVDASKPSTDATWPIGSNSAMSIRFAIGITIGLRSLEKIRCFSSGVSDGAPSSATEFTPCSKCCASVHFPLTRRLT